MPKGQYRRRPRGKYQKRKASAAPLAMVRRPLRSRVKSNQPHYHIRYETTDRTIDLANTNQFIPSAFSYHLDLLQSYTELGALYDNYKITKVVHYINWSPFSYSTGMNNDDKNPELMAPILQYYRDHDDDLATFTDSDFRQIAKVKQFRLRPGKQYKIAVTPSILTEAYRTGVTSAYMPKFGQKVDMATPDVKHLGLKIGLSKAPIALGTINIKTKYYVTCYGTR